MVKKRREEEEPEDVMSDLLEKLDNIATKIGEGAGYFWPLCVRQVFINFGIAFVWFFLSLGSMCFTYGYHLDHLKEGNTFILTGAAFIITISWVIFSVVNLINRLSQVLNPSYTALVELLKNREVK